METIHGEWYMQGCSANDPSCLHSAEDLRKLIKKIGFLPLFANEIPGFSVEERTIPKDWWSGDPEHHGNPASGRDKETCVKKGEKSWPEKRLMQGTR